MAYNPFDPQNPIKVTKVNCKKCQFEGNLQDFSQAGKYALKCPKCQEDHQLLFTFDDGKQMDMGKDPHSPLTNISIFVAVVIFFLSRIFLPSTYFYIITVILVIGILYLVFTNKDRRWIDKGGK